MDTIDGTQRSLFAVSVKNKNVSRPLAAAACAAVACALLDGRGLQAGWCAARPAAGSNFYVTVKRNVNSGWRVIAKIDDDIHMFIYEFMSSTF